MGEESLDILSLEKVIDGENVREIREAAFDGCENLETVEFGENLETIGDLAFWGCARLTTVPTTDALTYVGIRAFRHSALEELYLPDTAEVGEDAFTKTPFEAKMK